jgi:hypothetical protein
MLPDFLRIGKSDWEGFDTIALEAMSQTWIMISCSPVSGQMAFRFTGDARDKLTPASIRELEVHLENQEDWAFTHTGHMVACTQCRRTSQKELLEKVVEACALLGWKFKEPFVTADAGFPVVADKDLAVKVVWPKEGSFVEFHLLRANKLYRSVLEEFWLTDRGEILTPLAEVIKRVEADAVLFLDPLATHDTGRKNHNDTRTVRGVRELRGTKKS